MKTLAALLLLALPLPLLAQRPDPAVQRARQEAIQKLSWMVGVWEGEGWTQMGPNGRMTFNSSEVVEAKLDGSVLLIEGKHEGVMPGADAPQTVHHALAMLAYDPAAGHYTFQAQTFNRGGGTYEGRLTDGGFVWGMETPQGQIRYTITNDEDEWLEVGEFSRDGESWQQFFEMRLHRTDDSM